MDNNDQLPKSLSFLNQHLFGIMISLAMIIAFVLVIVSMKLYYSSGASQLDLSSPSYVDIRGEIENSNEFEEYSNTGKINNDSIDEFNSLLDQKIEKINTANAFASDPLDPTSLGMTVMSANVDIVVE